MNSDLLSSVRPAIVLSLLFALLLGIAYPLALTGIGQVAFPAQANGSLLTDAGGRVVGSALLAQGFASPRYFQPRPSAAGKGYDPLASGGSNLGPASKALADRVAADVAKQHVAGVAGPLPADLVTTSGSGLDPDLSPAAAMTQVARVARARGLPETRVRALVEAATATLLFGDPHVNVLLLNRQLDGAGVPSAR